MKNLLCFLFLVSGMSVSAQVAISTNGSLPDNSAILDVKSTTKGFLPPRVELTAINVAGPVTSPANGLFVYNTATSGTSPNNVIPGYYYWNGTRWVAVVIPQGTNPGEMLYWNGTQWVGLPVGSNGQVLTFNNGILVWKQPSFPCGSPLTINHIAGAVAPVDKTVTYGTVSTIPGENERCWITSNLGADHQATAVDDATEASAGWYWQFNRKQGYKHDGASRTPNTAWISSIDEDLDWQAANDPCALELGSGWRIPTYSEWTNVVAAGNWADWTGPWNSALKMHAAGFLEGNTGSLLIRGSWGFYWSSLQSNSTNGWILVFNNNTVGITNGYNKTPGFPLRCIQDSPDPVLPTITTGSVTNISQNNATCGGTVTSDGGAFVTSRGVCWNTSANPTIADSHSTDGTGTGSFESIVTGLTPNTLYYIRAYAVNSAGTGYGSELSFTTPAPFTCGVAITINHLAGTVAPVTKTVTYGTATNIPGEISRCWITSNLGSDHQATAVDDATEPSAGWYWQFNRKQGYKHDGTTRTPNTTWISSIDENFDWQAINDPCTLELGTGWRIPTATEWTNVDVSGAWTNWYGPWYSALRMHAAGYLDSPNGLLFGRGSFGEYWSSMQFSSTSSWNLYFESNGSAASFSSKELGFSLRCIKDLNNPDLPTVTTTMVTIINQNNATSGGIVTSDGGALVTSRGVCWSASPNPVTTDSHTTDGSGTGTFASALTGLTPNTLYYARAYATNSVGTGYGNEVTFTTPVFFLCGSSININHLAGVVAPVTKTVTYGTVTNIPGEASRCWITSNLGSDHQATAVDDATEASAGWYWQFNRKQGYKHDGTTRTPNTEWISSIDENMDWQAANDPCTLELGTGWRIPTAGEWSNVMNTGGWTNWNGPWNSALKLHAAGNLLYNDGSLHNRGSYGYYCSTTQFDATNGVILYFYSSSSMLGYGPKSYGFPIRCLKDN